MSGLPSDYRPAHPTADTVAAAQLKRISDIVERGAQLLPAQGPLSAFVFLNPLQALEDVPFAEAVERGSRLFGWQPYLPEERYRAELDRGRLQTTDLAAALRESLGDHAYTAVGPLGTRFDLRLAMLRHALPSGSTAELQWYVAEDEALRQFRPDAPEKVRRRLIAETRRWVMHDVAAQATEDDLPAAPADRWLQQLVSDFKVRRVETWTDAQWEAVVLRALWDCCRAGVANNVDPPPHPAPLIRHRDLLLRATGEDTDNLVSEVLIPFCAAFADQGLSTWALPDRGAGLFQSFLNLQANATRAAHPWLAGLRDEAERLRSTGVSAAESIHESLQLLGVPEDDWDDYLTASLTALSGWAGILWQLEVRPDRVALGAPTGTMLEYLAARLLLVRFAVAHVARRELHYSGDLAGLRSYLWELAEANPPPGPSSAQRAFRVFQLAQLLGWTPQDLHRLTPEEWSLLVREIESFDEWSRRRVLHQALELGFRQQSLDAIAEATARPAERIANPRFQVATCIDTREESFRRHLEEIDPRVETFGMAGFFGVPMYFKGVADAHYQALCPIVIRPQHWVVEEVAFPLEASHQRRARTRRALGKATHQAHVGSRSLAGGALVASVGVLAAVPMVARVLFPSMAGWIRRAASRLVAPPKITRLRLERKPGVTPGPNDDHIGFTVDEMTAMGERALRDLSLTHTFAPLVFLLGHGAECVNNPHKSSYDCGACSGSAGSPNARALAAILNDRRVRQRLAARGLEIPEETVFLGGLHNTTTDTIALFDLDLMPASHRSDCEAALITLEQACERNAHERCRRFDSAPLGLSTRSAHRHVAERAEDLAQVRPEFGNASNALCIVGRRERLRGLYLDRRSFLHSYDSSLDDAKYTVLARILGAVVPVCSGINLQYYFSATDSAGWGAGTKLPHNVVSLLGVMDGAASDLRCGLPQQGVEIHEPLRLLLVVEAAPEALFHVMANNQTVDQIIRNGWIQLALLDPASNALQLYTDGQFVPYRPRNQALPNVPSSLDWYRGWREHLGFAMIGQTPELVHP